MARTRGWIRGFHPWVNPRMTDNLRESETGFVEFDAELLKEFLNESWDNLEKLDQDFVELEQNPNDPEIITRIFRVIHTMKGCSGLLSFGRLEKISHYAEDILSQVREGKRAADPFVVTKLLEAADALKEILTVVEETQSEGEGDYTELIEELKRIAAGEGASSVAVDSGDGGTEETEGGPSKWQVTVYLSEEEKMPTIRALVVVQNLAKAGTLEEVIPDVRADESLKEGEALTLFLESDKSQEEIRGLAQGPSIKSVEVEPCEDLLASASASADLPATSSQEGQSSSELTDAVQKKTPAERVETSIRVDVSVVDKLMNLVGELVLSRNQILQFAGTVEDASFAAASHRISLVTSELQENIMKTRMQPVANVFNRFPRMVRDLAKDFGKKVDLTIEGKETELDRTLIEAIKDPMVHIIRNSLDHGIETPEERTANGKPPTGSLQIKAFHEGGQVNIQVSDDGAGVNTQRVKQLAVERGIISQQQADSISDKDAVKLIFTPGFSTAKKVTNVSGRGVGMDVVRSNIERIGGTVDLQSEFGQGTTLTVKIPLTLAIIPALMVSTAGQRFAIPQINVVELVGLEGEDLAKGIETVRNVEVYRLRGALLPIIRLTDVLGVQRNGQGSKAAYLVVLTTGNEQIGLLVDWVHDTEEIVVKPLSKHLKHLKAYAGATILGDGKVALILDVGGIVASVGLEFESVQEEASSEARKEVAAGEELREILLFRLGSDQQFAMPLGLVNRLEEFNRDEIETTSGREVIQYRGDLLPLIRPGNILNAVGAASEDKSILPAVVFSIEDRQVGFIVSEILDIQEVVLEFSRASVAEEGVLGTAIVNGKATQFLDAYCLLELAVPDWFGRTGEQRFGEGKRALLVDDSAFYRSMIGSYLEAAGYEVVEAVNGEEGLKQLERFEFDTILTDVEMPVMDGFDLIRNIGELDIYRHIPIVVLSIHAKPAYRERAAELGAAAYLVKLDRTELLRTLEELLAERTEA